MGHIGRVPLVRGGEAVTFYNCDGDPIPRPAIAVKDHHAGSEYQYPDLEAALGADRYAEIGTFAYDELLERFWRDAQDVADAARLGAMVEQEGRSGGWLVLVGRDPVGLTGKARRDWLAGYQSLRDWCARQISTGPKRHHALMRSMAINAVAQSAAQRMFGKV